MHADKELFVSRTVATGTSTVDAATTGLLLSAATNLLQKKKKKRRTFTIATSIPPNKKLSSSSSSSSTNLLANLFPDASEANVLNEFQLKPRTSFIPKKKNYIRINNNESSSTTFSTDNMISSSSHKENDNKRGEKRKDNSGSIKNNSISNSNSNSNDRLCRIANRKRKKTMNDEKHDSLAFRLDCLEAQATFILANKFRNSITNYETRNHFNDVRNNDNSVEIVLELPNIPSAVSELTSYCESSSSDSSTDDTTSTNSCDNLNNGNSSTISRSDDTMIMKNDNNSEDDDWFIGF